MGKQTVFKVPKYGYYEVTLLVAWKELENEKPEVIQTRLIAENSQDAWEKFQVYVEKLSQPTEGEPTPTKEKFNG